MSGFDAKHRAGEAAVACGAVAILSVFAPVLTAVPLGFVAVIALNLAGWALPVWIGYLLWRLTRGNVGAWQFALAAVLPAAAFAALVYSGRFWPADTSADAFARIAVSAAPDALMAVGLLALAAGLLRFSMVSFWIAWLGVAVAVASFAMAGPGAVAAASGVPAPVALGVAAYLTRALAATFFIAAGLSMSRAALEEQALEQSGE